MAEAQQITFTYKELVEIMLRQQGISDGLWALFIKFGIGAANIGEGPDLIRPSAIVPVMEIGIQRTDDRTNLTVDASELAKPSATKQAVRSR
ncbi:MAG: hypothetical protein M3P30_08640 [Chloroflexota bacterium]|nr:hypothetical protein [Chloroflexota bacterium]